MYLRRIYMYMYALLSQILFGFFKHLFQLMIDPFIMYFFFFLPVNSFYQTFFTGLMYILIAEYIFVLSLTFSNFCTRLDLIKMGGCLCVIQILGYKLPSFLYSYTLFLPHSRGLYRVLNS